MKREKKNFWDKRKSVLQKWIITVSRAAVLWLLFIFFLNITDLYQPSARGAELLSKDKSINPSAD